MVFKRSWLERNPGKFIVATVSVLLALTGAIAWLVSRARLKFLMLIFPALQFYAYSFMVTAFRRKYHRMPQLPSLGNAEGAAPPDQLFNGVFLLITRLIPFICGGIILMKLHKNT